MFLLVFVCSQGSRDRVVCIWVSVQEGLHLEGEGGWADHSRTNTMAYGQQAGGMHPTGMLSCVIM